MDSRFFYRMLISVLLAAVISPPAAAGVLWERTFGGGGNDHCEAVIRTSDGGFLLAGTTLPPGGGAEDIELIKVDAAGDVEWQDTYGGAAKDFCVDVIETAEGDFVVAGYTGVPFTYYDGLLMRVDSNGNELWQRTYGGTGKDFLRSVYEADNGDLVAAGDTRFLITEGGTGVYLIRTDAQGALRWQRGLGGSNDHGYGVAPSGDGGIVVAGYRGDGSIFPAYDALFMKTDSNGDALSTATYDNGITDYVYGMTPVGEGSFLLAGESGGLISAWKVDSAGALSWQRLYPAGDVATSAAVAADGGFLLGGFYYDQDDDKEFEFLVLETDSEGLLTAADSLGGTEWEYANDITAAPGGGYVVVGSSTSFGAGEYNWYAVRGNSSEAVTGAGVPSRDAIALRAVPNPFNPRTRLTFTLPEAGAVELTVYDLAGRRVTTVLEGMLSAGPQTIDWNGVDGTGKPVSSGVYFARLKAGGRTYVHKLVLSK
jgi:hypothetical protein